MGRRTEEIGGVAPTAPKVDYARIIDELCRIRREKEAAKRTHVSDLK